MKPLSLICILSLCSVSFMPGQSRISWELSLSANMGSSTEHVEQRGAGSQSTTGKYFSLALRTGYLINGPVELEPEILWTARSGQSPSYAVTGNLSYNMILSRSERIILFPLAGYGLARGVPAVNHLSVNTLTGQPKLSLLNLGAGMKMLVTRNVGLRFEYRFQRYSGILSDASSKYADSFESLFLGFSVFF